MHNVCIYRYEFLSWLWCCNLKHQLKSELSIYLHDDFSHERFAILKKKYVQIN